MSLKTQFETDNQSVFFNTDEFAESATLTTPDGVQYPIAIVRSSQSDFVPVEPGQGNSDTFEILKSADFEIVPNCRIEDSDGVVWVVQPGIRNDVLSGVYSAPVISNGRLKA